MTAPSLQPTERDVFTALRSVLLQMIPSIEVIRAQVNRTPEPQSADFIVMTQIMRIRLATNIDVFSDPFPAAGSRAVTQPTDFVVQLDIHGPQSGDNAQIISTLMRGEFATSLFDASGVPAQILWAEDARQIPFVNAEDQWETRWVMSLHLQVNEVVTTDQQFAAEVHVNPIPKTAIDDGIINVDAVYPP